MPAEQLLQVIIKQGR